MRILQNRVAFISVVGGALLVAIAIAVNSRRPHTDVQRHSAEAVKGTGVCLECHRTRTAAIVRQWEDSRHARVGVSCFDCHKPRDKAHEMEHKGFQITRQVTSGTCADCHKEEYAQFQRSRHAVAAWTAVRGNQDFNAAQLAEARKFHPEAIDRPPNPLPSLEGPGALENGCKACHEIGAPNYDNSIGNCTKCHGSHWESIQMARTSDTCGSCHMGPDHSQIEIWRESRHGVMFVARQAQQKLDVKGEDLTPMQQDAPTCATCHISGMSGMESTHDVGERLSYYLFDAVSQKRPNFEAGRKNMRAVCFNCHSTGHVDRFYAQADITLANTNKLVKEAQDLMAGLYKDKLLTPTPFDEPIEFLAFDLWHYYGRTAKHGAYMGGADFSQWHGNYELLVKLVELRAQAAQLRKPRP